MGRDRRAGLLIVPCKQSNSRSYSPTLLLQSKAEHYQKAIAACFKVASSEEQMRRSELLRNTRKWTGVGMPQ